MRHLDHAVGGDRNAMFVGLQLTRDADDERQLHPPSVPAHIPEPASLCRSRAREVTPVRSGAAAMTHHRSTSPSIGSMLETIATASATRLLVPICPMPWRL